ncbi:hypothetical protein VM1G_10362 [Cytospora mali]|uniref:Myb-like domain-containing protein n=1 Tax=Cytospora mali TaxID=578113 RepID=A0A194VI97_CYTMA|nr:hypothetical protein VM1G_10362 [Valsa mali]
MMAEQDNQRLLCPGCSHNLQGNQHPEPDFFRYLTIEEMAATGLLCQNLNCYMYIEKNKFFPKDVVTASQGSDHTAPPTNPAGARNSGFNAASVPTSCRPALNTNDAGGQVSKPGGVLAPSDPPSSRASIRNAWTQDESRLLLEMRSQGHSWDEIAEALPRHTVRSVESKWAVLAKS